MDSSQHLLEDSQARIRQPSGSTNSLFQSLDLRHQVSSSSEQLKISADTDSQVVGKSKRNPRSCTEYSKPLIVFCILAFSAAAFFILEVQQHLINDTILDAADIVLIVSYSVIWLLSVWSLIVMVKSCPGYIPYNYRFKPEKMSHRDRLINEHLRTALHSTLNQQRELLEHGDGYRGTYMLTSNGQSGMLGKSFLARKKMTFSGDRQPTSRMTASVKKRDAATTVMVAQSQRSSSEVTADDGLVYYQETEAEEVFRTSEFSRHQADFLFQDVPEDQNEQQEKMSNVKKSLTFEQVDVQNSNRITSEFPAQYLPGEGAQNSSLSFSNNPSLNNEKGGVGSSALSASHSAAMSNTKSNQIMSTLSAQVIHEDQNENSNDITQESHSFDQSAGEGFYETIDKNSEKLRASQSLMQQRTENPQNLSDRIKKSQTGGFDVDEKVRAPPRQTVTDQHGSADHPEKQLKKSDDTLGTQGPNLLHMLKYDSSVQPIESQVKLTYPPLLEDTSSSATPNPLKKANYEFAKKEENELVIDEFLKSQSSSTTVQLSEYQIDYLRNKFLNHCMHCNCVKPPRTHHCSTCGRCVIRMDHHCRWVANCVGMHNLKHFLLFVFYTAAVCVYTIVLFCMKGIQCAIDSADQAEQKCKQPHLMMAEYLSVSIAAAILDVLVGGFCICLFVHQLKLIKQNRSYIDNLQKMQDNSAVEVELATKLKNDELITFQSKSFFTRLADVMGDRSILWWFIPVTRVNFDEQAVENELNMYFMN